MRVRYGAVGRSVMLGIWTVFGLQACAGLSEKVGQHDPLTSSEHVTLGMMYEAEGYPELAAREYGSSIRSHGSPSGFIGLGNLALARNSLEESESYYLQALAIASEHPGANNNLAMLHLTRGRNLAEAERLARRALSTTGPLRPYVLDTLAHIYLRQGRYGEAADVLNEAEALAPTAPAPNDVLQHRLDRLRRELSAASSGEP